MLGKILGLAYFLVAFGNTDGPWNLLGVNGYSGEVIVNSTTGSGMFYIMFQSLGGDLNSDNRPLVVWLPGGPGCSLGLGMFGQRYSPFYVDADGNPQFNNLTWALKVHVLSVDFPYGVGYSSPTNYTDWVLKVSDGVTLFINFLDQLMTKYPSWFKRDIYLIGQDFAGLFIPSISNQIHLNNRNLLPGHPGYINLAGILLGDAWLNGAYQSSYYDVFAFNQGLVNRVQKDQITLFENYIIGNSTFNNPEQAFISFQNLNNYIESVTGSINTYNYRKYSPDNMGNLDAFFNNLTIKQEFNAPADVTWTACSGSVFNNLTDILFVEQSEVLSTVLTYFKVLIYSSQDDLLINSMGTQTVIRGLNWLGISDFMSARRGVWNVAGNIAGYAQVSTNLTYVQILNSGLGIGLDQTLSTRDMLYRFIFNQGWN
jgi:carboxypeptidase C (cathepsin A)